MSVDVFTRAQLTAKKWTSREIQLAVAGGQLFRPFRGVYTTSEPKGTTLLRAVLAAFPRAVFTGATAAQLYLGKNVTGPAEIVLPHEATAPKDSPLLRIRRSRGIVSTEIAGFPVTTYLKAAADTGLPLGRELLERKYQGKNGEADLERDLAERASISGELRRVLSEAAVGADSELERTLFRVLRGKGFEVRQNVIIGGYRFDGLINGRIVIEVDSYSYHRAEVPHGKNETAETFIRDRWKANIAQRLGYIVLRYTDDDIEYHLSVVVAQIEDTVRNCPSRKRRGVNQLLGSEKQMVWTWHFGITRFPDSR